MVDPVDLVKAALAEAHQALGELRANDATLAQIARAGELLAGVFSAGGKVMSCGNGGSMCDAMHFAEELTGRFRDDRPGLPALAISDASHLTCAGNDFGYDRVFARYVDAHARAGDALLAISTSGSSANVLKAAEAARARGVKVVSLTGRPGSKLAALADLDICTPGGRPYADRVQELHIKVIHMLIELCEWRLFHAGRQ